MHVPATVVTARVAAWYRLTTWFRASAMNRSLAPVPVPVSVSVFAIATLYGWLNSASSAGLTRYRNGYVPRAVQHVMSGGRFDFVRFISRTPRACGPPSACGRGQRNRVPRGKRESRPFVCWFCHSFACPSR